MVIETGRLLLREYTPDDSDATYEILSDPETMAHYPAPFDEARIWRWIDRDPENCAQYGFACGRRLPRTRSQRFSSFHDHSGTERIKINGD